MRSSSEAGNRRRPRRGTRPIRVHPRQGNPQASALVLERFGGEYVPNESELEFLLDELLEHPAIPKACRQHRPAWLPGVVRLDRWIPQWRMVIEADGRAWHTKSADFERDRERDNAAAAAAAAAGAVVLRLTRTMLRKAQAQCRGGSSTPAPCADRPVECACGHGCRTPWHTRCGLVFAVAVECASACACCVPKHTRRSRTTNFGTARRRP
jgi:hypothetical protein